MDIKALKEQLEKLVKEYADTNSVEVMGVSLYLDYVDGESVWKVTINQTAKA